MSKRVLSLIITAVLILAALPLSVSAAQNDNGFSYIVVDGEAIITEYDVKYGTDVVIPELLGGYPVTEIGSNAFSPSEIKSILISDTVRRIQGYAFSYGITELTVPENVEYIDPSAFNYCSYLKSITVSDENSAYSSENGVLFSKDKTVLVRYPQEYGKSFSVPESVKTISAFSFYNCNIVSVDMGENVESIDNYAFCFCLSLESVKLGNGLKSIGSYAFAYCGKLTNIELPESLSEIRSYAFTSSALKTITE